MARLGGVFELPDTGWASLWASDPLANRQSTSASYWDLPLIDYRQRNSQFGGISYDPSGAGDPYDPFSSGTQDRIDADVDSWLQREHPELFNFPAPGGGPVAGVGQATGNAAVLNQYDAYFQEAMQKYGTPANLLKGLAMMEEGYADPVSDAGAQGIMQIMPQYWGDEAASLGYGDYITNPRSNILMGAYILSGMNKGDPTWETGVRSYLGGDDPYTGVTNDQYWTNIKTYWDQLNASAGGASGGFNGSPGTPGQGTPGTQQFNAIWGGQQAPITQEFGHTEFSGSVGSYYDYGADYTRNRQPMGHPAVDVGVGYGTNLFAPVAGTVTIAGGSGYYCDADGRGCGPGVGELLITTANGDQVILGHMSNITVKVGDQITAGSFVGTSGSENGAHVHVEYRKWVGQGVTNSGYEVLDPRQALAGNFTGSYGSTQPGQAYVAGAGDWASFMRQAASGGLLQPHGAGSPYDPYGGFHSWLRGQVGQPAQTTPAP